MSIIIDNDKFLERANKIHNFEYEYLNEYINAKTKVKIKHIICQGIFEQTPDKHLNSKQGCPYCCTPSKKLLRGFNDLQSQFPIVAKQWHPTKNGDLKPFNVMSGSEIKVWWLCSKCSNEWQAVIYSRTFNNNGCLICGLEQSSKKRILTNIKKDGSLKDNFPKLCLEWDYEKNKDKPEDYLSYSNVQKHWKCLKCNNEWISTICNRSSGRGCPYCIFWNSQEEIRDILEQLFRIKFIKKRFKYKKQNLEFDGYNEQLKIAFEYNGYQHYVYPNFFCKTEQRFLDQQKRDQLKIDYCKKNKIKLIIVPYTIKEKNFKSYIRNKCKELKINVCQFDF